VRLNGTDVTTRERMIAERFYLSSHAGEWWDAKEAGGRKCDEFCAKHPQYKALIAAHAEPDKPVAAVKAIKAGFVSLTIQPIGAASAKVIQLPARTTVARLRQILQAKKALPPRSQVKAALIYIDLASGSEQPLDDDLRDLCFFEMTQGSIKVVDRV
jgi:hypothetical protein